jgi:hypothetical protein
MAHRRLSALALLAMVVVVLMAVVVVMAAHDNDGEVQALVVSDKPRTLLAFFPHSGTFQKVHVKPESFYIVDNSNRQHHRTIRSASMSSATRAVSFQLSYTDSAGVGFNDPTLGATRRACFEAVMAYLSSTLIASTSRTVVVDVSSISDSSQGFLAQGGSFYAETPFAQTVTQRVVCH